MDEDVMNHAIMRGFGKMEVGGLGDYLLYLGSG